MLIIPHGNLWASVSWISILRLRDVTSFFFSWHGPQIWIRMGSSYSSYTFNWNVKAWSKILAEQNLNESLGLRISLTCLMSPYFTGGWLFTILVADSSCWLNWEFMQHESSKYHYTISITAVHPDLLIYKNILSHRIHGTGTGIFTYMKTIKINGIHIP